MEKYFLVALPEENTLQKLNELRQYLYSNGYRYSNELPTSDVHITLAQTNLENEDILTLKSDLKNFLEEQESFTVEYDHITNESRSANEKYPKGYAWIALYFKDGNLTRLSEKIDNYLISKGISSTKEYTQEVGNIADHLNLCNYAKSEMAESAKKYIHENSPKNLEITKIGLRRRKGGELLWTIGLG